MKFYHVTTMTNYRKMTHHGYLLPQIGPRSAKIGEPTSAIYLFNTLEDCNDGVTNWLGDEFDDDESLIYLEVTINQSDKALIYQPQHYESKYVKPINLIHCKIVKIET